MAAPHAYHRGHEARSLVKVGVGQRGQRHVSTFRPGVE
jgi:hypothetical protein